MKKNIILFNILALIVTFIIAEACFYHNFLENASWVVTQNLPYFHNEDEDVLDVALDYRKYPDRFSYLDKNYDKEPVLLLGCSYAYGQYLSEKENFAGILKKLTNRPVYNLGVIARDPALALMLLERFKKDKNITQKPKYIIYTYMFHHLQRLHAWNYYDFYRKRGYIPSQKYNLLYHSYIYHYFKDRKLDEKLWYDWDFSNHQKIFFNIVKDMEKNVKEINPDSKLIILIYNDENYDLVPNLWNTVGNNEYKMNKLFEIQESEKFKKELEKAGAIVISTKDLLNRTMDKPTDRVSDDPNHPHPSALAWRMIIPKLIERLKL